MTNAPVAVDLLETLHVSLQLSPEVTLDERLIAGDDVDDLGNLVIAELTGPQVGIDPGLIKDLLRRRASDSINIR